MRHQSKEGAPLVKSIRVRVFNEENRGSTVRTIKADPGTGFNEKYIADVLDKISEDLERHCPASEFSLVELGQGHFNFVWRGYRVAPASQEPVSA